MSVEDAGGYHPASMTPKEHEPRSARLSATEMTELVLPQHANALGTAFGGTLMSWIDICAAITAERHCGSVAVTALVDEIELAVPIRVGNIVRLLGCVNAAFRTSMEIHVHVSIDDPARRTETSCADALLTFVRVDADGRACPVPPLIIETDDDRRREAAARERRELRLKRKARG
jgi:acyl-CoA hydrolase